MNPRIDLSKHAHEYGVVDGAETTTIETHEERQAHSVTRRRGQYGPEVVEVREKTVIKRVETITPLMTITLRPHVDINIDMSASHDQTLQQEYVNVRGQLLRATTEWDVARDQWRAHVSYGAPDWARGTAGYGDTPAQALDALQQQLVEWAPKKSDPKRLL